MALSFISGLLLILCFPPYNLAFLSWFCLAPLLWALIQAPNRKQATLRAYLCGVVFFTITVSWIRHVTWAGYVASIFYLSIYFALFGFCVKSWLDDFKNNPSFKKSLVLSFVIPILWTACEFMRAMVPVMGMEWADLAHAQTYSPFLQLARLGGEFLVTFLVAFINTLVFMILSVKKLKQSVVWVVLGALAITGSVFYAKKSYSQATLAGPLRIGVLQGNIPQNEKWDMTYRIQIIERYGRLSLDAHAQKANLIVWPEAAFPDFFERSYETSGLSELVRELKTPMLIGSPYLNEHSQVSNSAILVNQEGRVIERYDKMHLVPFGEYVPGSRFLFFLKPAAEALGVGDFQSGMRHTIFELPMELNQKTVGVKFSTLICFEDMFSELVRPFVAKGAEFLIVMTNDAWFLKSGAPYQHLQGSVFRAVENGVWVIRAANTGISCVIAPNGEVLDRVKQDENDIFVQGVGVWSIPYEKQATLFQKGGWLFPYLCFLLLLVDQILRGLPRLTHRVK